MFACCVCTAVSSLHRSLHQIQSEMQLHGLSLVGWYHSHTECEPRPTYQDVVLQKKYQNIVREVEPDEPCIGFIVSEWALSTSRGQGRVMGYVCLCLILLLSINSGCKAKRASNFFLQSNCFWVKALDHSSVSACAF